MLIRDLINLLEQYAHDSDQKDLTEVSVNLNVGMWTANCSVPAKIEDVVISFEEKDSVQFEVVVSPENARKVLGDYEKFYGGFERDF